MRFYTWLPHCLADSFKQVNVKASLLIMVGKNLHHDSLVIFCIISLLLLLVIVVFVTKTPSSSPGGQHSAHKCQRGSFIFFLFLTMVLYLVDVENATSGRESHARNKS